jgi:hypothetical protein
MTERTITIEHNGKTYSGQIATIKSTTLGMEDHGIVTAYLNCEWSGAGIGVGGMCLDAPVKDENGKFLRREGTAYGLDHLMALVNTVGAPTWEKLTGRQVIILFEGKSLWGSTASGIAGLTNDKVLILKEHAESWLARDKAVA